MSWLVNPDEDEDEAVLFNAEEDDFLDYEDNPKKRSKRRKGRKSKKAKAPRKIKRRKVHRKAKKAAPVKVKRKRHKRRKHRASTIKFIEAPKKAKRHKRRKTRKHKKAVRKHKRKARKTPKMSFQSNPRRRHKRRHARRNPTYPFVTNARKTKRHKRRWKARVWKSNPFGSIKGMPDWMKFPSMADVKAKPWHAVGFGLLGIVDTGLIGKGIEYAISKSGTAIPEPAADAIRIGGKFAAGTAISFAIAKFGKNNSWAKFHQTGVYIGVIADTVFTVAKYVIRRFGANRYKVTTPIKMPMTAKGIAMNAFGLGSLGDLLEERKLVSALETDGLVVAGNELGEVALADAVTGDIIVSGPADQMAPVVQAVQGVAFYTGDVNDDGESGLGEDITVES